MMNKNSYIISLEGKDILNAQKYKRGFDTKTRGKWIYKGSLDFSLEALKILTFDKKAFWSEGDKQYTKSVVNVTFKYAIKAIRFRKPPKGKCVAKVRKHLNIKPYPYYEDKNTQEIRAKLYEDGFKLDGKQYVRFKRSGGASRVGKCLFVRKDLYKKLMMWSYLGLEYKDGEEMDLASMEAYISLTTSSIIDTIDLDPKSILLIEDYESVFKDTVMATEWDEVNQRLVTRPKTTDIANSIWDGQSLLDISVFGKYADKGFLLFREQFFKSACFNTNIQKFFEDNGITDISQLNGITMAKDIKDIKMITTPSSIKYMKMAKQHKMFKVDGKYDKIKAFEYWVNNIEGKFGVVKYEKAPHNMHEMVSTHYQLLNTLPLSRDDMKLLMGQTLDYIKLLKDDLSVFRYHIGLNADNIKEGTDLGGDFTNSNQLIYDLLMINDKFAQTKMFYNFKMNLIASFKNNIRKGHILINGNYSVLCGNGHEMLLHSIGKFDGKSNLKTDEVHNYAFEYDKELIGIRSPHVTMGNVWVCTNRANEPLDTYFNSTKYIIHVNSINNNLLQILSGADFDSDSILVSDNEILVESAKKIYGKFLVPTDFTPKKSVNRTNSIKDKIDLDIKTSKNLIGEIINLSQILNSEYWDRVAKGQDVEGLYELISQLDVMSCIEIDKAKKESVVNSEKELKLIRESKWIQYGEITRDKKPKTVMCRPYFFKFVGEGKDYKFVKKETPMDYLEQIIDKEVPLAKYQGYNVNFLDLLDDMKVRTANRVQVNSIMDRIETLNNEIKFLWTTDMPRDEKLKISTYKKEEVSEQVAKMKINELTIYTLIRRLNKDYKDKYDNLKKSGLLLLNILYNTHKEKFLSLFKDNKDDIFLLSETQDSNYDIGIYDNRFVKIKK